MKLVFFRDVGHDYYHEVLRSAEESDRSLNMIRLKNLGYDVTEL